MSSVDELLQRAAAVSSGSGPARGSTASSTTTDVRASTASRTDVTELLKRVESVGAESAPEPAPKEVFDSNDIKPEVEDVENDPRIRAIFDAIDADHSGSITPYELETVFRSLDRALSKDEIVTLIEELDTDHDGGISYDEFKTGFSTWISTIPDDESDDKNDGGNGDGPPSGLSEEQRAQIHNVFAACDQNQDGQIDSAELNGLLSMMGRNPDEAGALLSQLDTDGDGQISLAEFEVGFAKFISGQDDDGERAPTASSDSDEEDDADILTAAKASYRSLRREPRSGGQGRGDNNTALATEEQSEVLLQRIADLQSAREILETRTSILTQQVMDLDQSETSLLDEFEDVKSELARARAELAQLSDVESSNAQLVADLRSQDSARAQAEQEKAELEKSQKKLLASLGHTESQLLEYQQKLEAEEEARAELEQEAESAKQLAKENEAIRAELKAMREASERLNDVEKKNASLEEQLQSMLAENVKLKADLDNENMMLSEQRRLTRTLRKMTVQLQKPPPSLQSELTEADDPNAADSDAPASAKPAGKPPRPNRYMGARLPPPRSGLAQSTTAREQEQAEEGKSGSDGGKERETQQGGENDGDEKEGSEEKVSGDAVEGSDTNAGVPPGEDTTKSERGSDTLAQSGEGDTADGDVEQSVSSTEKGQSTADLVKLTLHCYEQIASKNTSAMANSRASIAAGSADKLLDGSSASPMSPQMEAVRHDLDALESDEEKITFLLAKMEKEIATTAQSVAAKRKRTLGSLAAFRQSVGVAQEEDSAMLAALRASVSAEQASVNDDANASDDAGAISQSEEDSPGLTEEGNGEVKESSPSSQSTEQGVTPSSTEPDESTGRDEESGGDGTATDADTPTTTSGEGGEGEGKKTESPDNDSGNGGSNTTAAVAAGVAAVGAVAMVGAVAVSQSGGKKDDGPSTTTNQSAAAASSPSESAPVAGSGKASDVNESAPPSTTATPADESETAHESKEEEGRSNATGDESRESDSTPATDTEPGNSTSASDDKAKRDNDAGTTSELTPTDTQPDVQETDDAGQVSANDSTVSAGEDGAAKEEATRAADVASSEPQGEDSTACGEVKVDADTTGELSGNAGETKEAAGEAEPKTDAGDVKEGSARVPSTSTPSATATDTQTGDGQGDKATEWPLTPAPDGGPSDRPSDSIEDQLQAFHAMSDAMRAFWKGDYLDLNNHSGANATLLTWEPDNSSILFSDIVKKVNRLKFIQKRTIVVTNNALYNVKKLKKDAMVLRRRIPLPDIESVHLAVSDGNAFIVRVNDEYDYMYLSDKRTELIDVLMTAYEAVEKKPLKIEFADEIEMRRKDQKSVWQVKFANKGFKFVK